MKQRLVFLSVITAVVSGIMVLSACASTSSGSNAEPVQKVANPRVSTYLRTWPIVPNGDDSQKFYWDASMIKGEYLTDVIIAFALIDQDDGYSIYIPELRPLADGFPMFTNLWDEVAKLKEKYPHLKINFSVGGFGAEGFSDMANDPNLRGLFVAGVMQWLEDHNLDGVDIDWEYPVGPEWGQEIKSRSSDKKNYITLLQDLRNAMDVLGEKTGKRYGLSTAVPASAWFPQRNDVRAAVEIVDCFKLMSYDYYGGWCKNAGHHINIYNNPRDPEWGGWSTDQALKAYIAAKVPPEKMMMGFGFYGRAFQGVAPGSNEDGLFRPYKSLPTDPPFDQGTITWDNMKQFLEPDSGYTRYWDDKAKAPYLYNGDIWISYSDQEHIKLLTDYVKEKNMGGVFVWEYANDLNAELMQFLSENAPQ